MKPHLSVPAEHRRHQGLGSRCAGFAAGWSALFLAVHGYVAAQPPLVPPPASVQVLVEQKGFSVGETLQLVLPDDLPLIQEHFDAVAMALKLAGGCQLAPTSDGDDDPSLPTLVVTMTPAKEPEEYALSVREKSITIEAATVHGVAHATASLLQMLGDRTGRVLPAMDIQDKPSCGYRSFMIDLGRNPHSLACLKETVDLLWYYKVESLHLHLTDDQRFAFPSRAFPKLLSRDHVISWEEFEELDRYAQARGVALIPELEVPGHSGILRKQYPDVFGASATDVARLPSSRRAIKTLLEEMIEVFASAKYMHVGGDEAFGVPEDLQRDLINDLHAYLSDRGKKTLVWEGPRLGVGENKVHEEVCHINWRTINFPANQMLKAGYPVVNAAWDPLYVVDHYPRNNFTMVSPEHIFTTLELRRFKHVNPGIPTFANPVEVDPNDRLIGFCMPWWEGREVNFFPLVVPRLIPMASVAWNHDQSRDYKRFEKVASATEEARLRCFYPVSIHAAPLILDREGVFAGTTDVSLQSSHEGTVRYTIDGSQPTTEDQPYDSPIPLASGGTIRAALFRHGDQVGHGSRRTFVQVDPVPNLALGKPVTVNVGTGPLLSPARLTDGGLGNLDFFLGYPAEPDPIEITVDLGNAQLVDRVVTHAYFNGNTFESHAVQVSDDGVNFETVSERWERPEVLGSQTVHQFPQRTARFIRILTRGCKGYVFDSFSKLTEIQVFAGEPSSSGEN